MRNYVKKGVKTEYSEEFRDIVLKALKKAKKTGKSDIQVANEFGIPPTTLYRWKTYNKNCILGTGKTPVFNVKEELLLGVYLVYSAKYGFPQNTHQLQLCVQSFLQYLGRKNPFKAGKPGKEWIRNFKKRNKDIVKDRKRESLSLSRATALRPKNLRDFFVNVYKPLYDKYGLLMRPQCVWNLDETGFQAAKDVKGGRVFVSSNAKHAYSLTATATKNSFTVLTCGSAAGHYMPPFLLVKSKSGFTKGSITGGPPGTAYGFSKNGWMEGPTFQNWFINHFIPYVKKVDEHNHHVLVLDGHNSHLTYKTFQAAKAANITICCLPPNTSHATQPLDVGVFKNMKQKISELILEYWRTSGQEKIDKNNFPIVLKHLWPKLEKEWIISGFKSSGLHPYNQEACDKRTIQDSESGVRYEKIRGKRPCGAVRAVIKAIHDTLKPEPNELVKEARAKRDNLKRIQAIPGEVMTEEEGMARMRQHEEDMKAKQKGKGKGKGSGASGKGKAKSKPNPKAKPQCKTSSQPEDTAPIEVSETSSPPRDHVVTRKRKLNTIDNYISKRVKGNDTPIRAEPTYEGGPMLAFSEDVLDVMTSLHTGEKPINARQKKKATNTVKKPINTGEKPINAIFSFPRKYEKSIRSRFYKYNKTTCNITLSENFHLYENLAGPSQLQQGKQSESDSEIELSESEESEIEFLLSDCMNDSESDTKPENQSDYSDSDCVDEPHSDDEEEDIPVAFRLPANPVALYNKLRVKASYLIVHDSATDAQSPCLLLNKICKQLGNIRVKFMTQSKDAGSPGIWKWPLKDKVQIINIRKVVAHVPTPTVYMSSARFYQVERSHKKWPLVYPAN